MNGWSKWCVERVLRDYAASDKNFAFVALRYFNVAGSAADGSWRRGVRFHGSTPRPRRS